MRVVETWDPPSMVAEDDVAAVSAYLRALDDSLAPAHRGELLSRMLALLSHFRSDQNPPAVEAMIADDWAEDLGRYPMWVVDAAARHWRRSRRFRPQICEMIKLCDAECEERMKERDRLRSVLERAGADRNSHGARMREIARGALRRFPGQEWN